MNGNELRNGLLPLAAVLVAGLLAAPPATLGAQMPASVGGITVAEATVHGGGVDFRPTVSHAGGKVTVSGNGMVFQRAVESGASASIGAFDLAGRLLPDGVYSWELELLPDARTAKKLRAAAELNNGRAPGAWQPLSGSFAIRDGLVVDANLVEAGPAPRQPVAGSALPETVGGPRAVRGPAVDDDAAVGSRKGVEAEMNAALASRPKAAAGPGQQRHGRSDAAAVALGGSPERALAPAGASREARPIRQSRFDNTDNGANGRDHSARRQ